MSISGREAGIYAQTIDRIEKGKTCRLETKKKIILALRYKISDKGKFSLKNKG